jgi:DNA polymerase-3 subunit delta'
MPDLVPEERHALTLLARGSIGRALGMAAGGQLASYQRLIAALAAAPVDHVVLDDLSGELTRTVDASLTGVLALLQELLGRVIAAGLGRLGPALFPDEASQLAALAASRPLDRWATLWDKVARLAAAAEGLSLERSHALMQMLTLLAPDADRAARSGALGANHVRG